MTGNKKGFIYGVLETWERRRPVGPDRAGSAGRGVLFDGGMTVTAPIFPGNSTPDRGCGSAPGEPGQSRPLHPLRNTPGPPHHRITRLPNREPGSFRPLLAGSLPSPPSLPNDGLRELALQPQSAVAAGQSAVSACARLAGRQLRGVGDLGCDGDGGTSGGGSWWCHQRDQFSAWPVRHGLAAGTVSCQESPDFCRSEGCEGAGTVSAIPFPSPRRPWRRRHNRDHARIRNLGERAMAVLNGRRLLRKLRRGTTRITATVRAVAALELANRSRGKTLSAVAALTRPLLGYHRRLGSPE
ncbi:hypothetical protein GCM10010420_15250 [Streptomyces glaucosporus]|uniref:Transposase n=1 Tax=Streptomyces glaucosporus TaxID=284044 RepID=A0ABP5V0V2_9ACTN